TPEVSDVRPTIAAGRRCRFAIRSRTARCKPSCGPGRVSANAWPRRSRGARLAPQGVAAEVQVAGLSTGAFSVLVVLTTAGGELELRTLRRRLGWSKADAHEGPGGVRHARVGGH